jgi:hypothetical protein
MAIARRADAQPVSLARDQAIAKAKAALVAAHADVKIWDEKHDAAGAELSRIRQDIALDELLALGVGR